MDKKLLKKILIIGGIVYLLGILLIMFYYDNDMTIIELLADFIGGILSSRNAYIYIPGIVLFIAGFMMDCEQIDSNKKSIKKYIKLRHLAFIIFSIILFYAIIAMFSGVSFMTSDVYGFDALILVFIMILHTPWAFIALILIIFSSLKIRKIRKAENNQATELDKSDCVNKIKKYKELLDSGIITQEEFDAKKKQLLDI